MVENGYPTKKQKTMLQTFLRNLPVYNMYLGITAYMLNLFNLCTIQLSPIAILVSVIGAFAGIFTFLIGLRSYKAQNRL